MKRLSAAVRVVKLLGTIVLATAVGAVVVFAFVMGVVAMGGGQ